MTDSQKQGGGGSAETLRARWVATSQRDFRAEGNRRAYHAAYDRYYHELGRALGLHYDRPSRYYVAADGSMPGINDMEQLLEKGSK